MDFENEKEQKRLRALAKCKERYYANIRAYKKRIYNTRYQKRGSSLQEKKEINPKQEIVSIISELVPKRLAIIICHNLKISGRIADMSKKLIVKISDSINNWIIKPTGSEGYRTAEVTLGGVDTKELSSKTMMSKKNEGLYFIGEVVDVTGHLGGYNFQWAWSSGYVAGQYV